MIIRCNLNFVTGTPEKQSHLNSQYVTDQPQLRLVRHAAQCILGTSQPFSSVFSALMAPFSKIFASLRRTVLREVFFPAVKCSFKDSSEQHAEEWKPQHGLFKQALQF